MEKTFSFEIPLIPTICIILMILLPLNLCTVENTNQDEVVHLNNVMLKHHDIKNFNHSILNLTTNLIDCFDTSIGYSIYSKRTIRCLKCCDKNIFCSVRYTFQV